MFWFSALFFCPFLFNFLFFQIEFKICLIVFKALRFGQPKYIADMLSPPVTISHLTLRSDDDPYRLHEPRAVDERAFAERSFVYTAPRCIMDCQPL